MKGLILYSFLILVLSGCYLSEDVPEDQDVWEYSQPSAQNLSSSILLDLDQQIKIDINESMFLQNVNSLIIIRNDHLVFENYYNNHGRSSIFPIGKIGIGIVSALFGEVLNNELAGQLDTRIDQFFPDYESIFNESPTKRDITIRHLLSMTSGLAWNESIFPIDNPESNLSQLLNSSDFISFILSRQLEAPPGIRFSENSGNSILLLHIMDQLIDESLADFFQSRLFDPLEITTQQVSMTPGGLPNYSLGLSMNTIDFTKIGYLMIKDGEWGGFQVVDPRWLDTILSTQRTLSNNTEAGFHWFRFPEGSFVDERTGIQDFNYQLGEFSQGLFFSEDAQIVMVSTNGLDPARGLSSSSSFSIFNRFLEAVPFNGQ